MIMRLPMAQWVRRRLPRPLLRTAATGSPRAPVESIIFFGRMPNPTYDYYFCARLQAEGMPPFRVVDIRDPSLMNLQAKGVFAIVCRYATSKLLDWIEKNTEVLSGVGLFLDDDIPAVVTGRDASFAYRLSLVTRALMPLRRLNQHIDVVWVSTSQLASRLHGVEAKILPPSPAMASWQLARPRPRNLNGERVRLAYHATGVHLEEHLFLRPIIERVMRDRPVVDFEVFADSRAQRVWKGIDRALLREPLPWDAYLADAKTHQIDIMLVPLVRSYVNDSRAPTKRIDVARYGAAGIFSEGEVYGLGSRSAELLLEARPDEWRSAIIKLVDDPTMRNRFAKETESAVLKMMTAAVTGIDMISGHGV